MWTVKIGYSGYQCDLVFRGEHEARKEYQIINAALAEGDKTIYAKDGFKREVFILLDDVRTVTLSSEEDSLMGQAEIMLLQAKAQMKAQQRLQQSSPLVARPGPQFNG